MHPSYLFNEPSCTPIVRETRLSISGDSRGNLSSDGMLNFLGSNRQNVSMFTVTDIR